MLKKIVNNISNLSINSLAQKVFKESGITKLILNLNREGQLFAEGVGVDGNVIAKYTYATQLLSDGISGKGFPKNAGEPYNFYSTGNMYNSFSVRIENDGFVINADTSDLLDGNRNITSDKQILGLTDESKIKLVKEITPFFIEQLRKEMFK
jgi:hypothetical protein